MIHSSFNQALLLGSILTFGFTGGCVEEKALVVIEHALSFHLDQFFQRGGNTGRRIATKGNNHKA